MTRHEPRDGMHDHDVLAEIDLYGELVIAASASPGRLSDAEIDRILGVGVVAEPGDPQQGPRLVS